MLVFIEYRTPLKKIKVQKKIARQLFQNVFCNNSLCKDLVTAVQICMDSLAKLCVTEDCVKAVKH